MPKDQERYISDPKYIIVRARCYGCAIPDWIPLEDIFVSSLEHNTITVLCDACERRYNAEGEFWINKYVKESS